MQTQTHIHTAIHVKHKDMHLSQTSMLPAAAALCAAVVICIWVLVAAIFHHNQHPACHPRQP